MPTIDIKNLDNKKVGAIELPDEIFALSVQGASHPRGGAQLPRRSPPGHAQDQDARSEVSGSGKKPFRQKGTGRARQGGIRPQFSATAARCFGPVPRDYSYKMNTQGEEDRPQVGALAEG